MKFRQKNRINKKLSCILYKTTLIVLASSLIYLLWTILIGILWAVIKYKSINKFGYTVSNIQVAVIIATVVSKVLIGLIYIWYRVEKMDSKTSKNKKNAKKLQEEITSIHKNQKLLLSDNIGLPISKLNQHTLLVGTTGSGKTTTLVKIIKELKQKTHAPIIIIDGKGDKDLINQVKLISKKTFVWSIDDTKIYNPLSSKNEVMLADKIMSLFEFSETHYENVAHNYLLKLLHILLAKEIPISFENIINYFPLARLKKLSFDFKIELEQFNEKDINGLLHKLDLSYTQLRQCIGEKNSLNSIFEQHDIVIFSLNSLTYPKLASSVGKMIIQDIKEFITIKDQNLPLNLVLDEFNVFVTDHIINLINKGRGYKLNCLLAFQTNSDLKMVHRDITDTIYGNCSNIICHKINDPNTANYVASLFGTQEIDELTKQIDLTSNSSMMGSIRRVDEFKAHPDDIKNLKIGEAFIKIPLPSGKIFTGKITVDK